MADSGKSYTKFWHWVEQERKRRKMSYQNILTEAHDKLGYEVFSDPAAIWRASHKRSEPSLKMLSVLAAGFGVSRVVMLIQVEFLQNDVQDMTLLELFEIKQRLTPSQRRDVSKMFAPDDSFPHRSIVDDELRNQCAEFLNEEDKYADAIRRAGIVLEERLRKTIGGNGPENSKNGVELVDYAVRKDSGQLIIRQHPAEQEGVHMLFRGAVQLLRNPPSHKKMRYTEVEAVQAIGLIDFLLYLLKQAKSK